MGSQGLGIQHTRFTVPSSQRLWVSDQFTEDLGHVRVAGSAYTILHSRDTPRYWPSPSLSEHPTGTEVQPLLRLLFHVLTFSKAPAGMDNCLCASRESHMLALLCNTPLCCYLWLHISISPTICSPETGTVLALSWPGQRLSLRRQMLTYPQGSLQQ